MLDNLTIEYLNQLVIQQQSNFKYALETEVEMLVQKHNNEIILFPLANKEAARQKSRVEEGLSNFPE